VHLVEEIHRVAAQAPFRTLITPAGVPMVISMTNCGLTGWISSGKGYRYADVDPLSGKPWPGMPAAFLELAQQAAQLAGFDEFRPSICLINRYAEGTGLQMHQDRDETRDGAPVVSVSLGLPAVFRFGAGPGRDQASDIPLQHGDVVVWGGPSRMAYHGVLPIAPGEHALTGRYRFNLTFRTTRPRRERSV
jgi:alkylated DNA repair protein (DNA oxidative demethylase)